MKDEKREIAEDSRRRFLKSAGKLAVYAPPAMMIVSKPSFANIALSGGGGIPVDNVCDTINCELD